MNYSKTISSLRSGGYISKTAYVRIPHGEQRPLICQSVKAEKQARGIQGPNTGGNSEINFAMNSPTGYFLNDFVFFNN